MNALPIQGAPLAVSSSAAPPRAGELTPAAQDRIVPVAPKERP